MKVLVLEGTTREQDHLAYRPALRHASFQRAARTDLGSVDPLQLLARQMRIFANAGFDTRVFKNVIRGSRRWIAPISCIESYFMELHGATLRKALYGHYSEFGVYFLRGPEGEPRRFYFQSNAETAALPTSSKIHAGIQRDLARGYRLETHLHNHPFSPRNPAGDIAGTPIPSGDGMTGGDFSAFALMRSRFGLREARITNGFHTLRIRTQDLPELLRD